jgi:hypothetical protein
MLDAGVENLVVEEGGRLWRAESGFTGPSDYVLATSTGRKLNPSNLRRDVLARAVKAADGKLATDGIAAIGPIGFHSLRRTYASLRCACDDVAYTSSQIGHEDARFTLRVYTQATKRRDRLSGPHLRAYDRALAWAQMGTNDVPEPAAVPREATENPAVAGLLQRADDGTRTHDLLHGKQTL